ncbi:TraB/GumN family protein [Parasediminibacterium paludis]|uniref:TraB/GumN family protein n=1 Tax=Parasediminibacterium paludis TaxID=908966 RepID=A0ABV8PUA1_9BACT
MRYLFGLIIPCFFALHAHSQIPKEKTLLWEISGKGIKHPSYLYGTIHVMCPDQIVIDTSIKKAFNNSKQLYLEIDLDDPNMVAKAMKGMMMPDTCSLEKLVGKADYDSMNTIFKNTAGITLSIMGKAKPMLLMSAVFPAILKCNPDGFEKRFQAMAKAKNMELKGLETIEYQMRVFDTIPFKVQADMLKNMLYNLDSAKLQFAELGKVYLSKDVNAMQELTTKDPEFGKYDAMMLQNRNQNWIPVIIAEAQAKPTFFAVGAAHLGGINGVIYLLRKQGYQVEPVFN